MRRRGNLMTSGSISLDQSGMFEDDPLLNYIKGESGIPADSPLSSHRLQRANARYKRLSRSYKEADSLLDLAVKYHNPSAVKVLLDAGVEKNQTPDSIAMLLGDLFSTNALFSRKGAAEEIYDYLASKSEFSSLLTSIDPNILDQILVTSARHEAFESLQVMLDKKIINNVNAVDSLGHTALYYVEHAKIEFMSSDKEYHEAQALQAALVSAGAVLNTRDLIGLDQQKFYVQLKSALKSQDKVIAHASISKLLAVPDLLTDKQFEKCFIRAIFASDVEAVKLLLTSSHMPSVDLFHEDVVKNINNVDIAEMIADYTVANHSIEKLTPTYHATLTGLAHRIGLSGVITIKPDSEEALNIKLEGNTEEKSMRVLRVVVDEYAEKHADFQPFAEAINYTASVASIQKVEIFCDVMVERYQQENPIIINSGWNGHSVGLGVKYDAASNKTYVSVSNRGEGGLIACLVPGTLTGKLDQKSGTLIYEMDGVLNKDFFKKFGCFNHKFYKMTEFSKSLADFLRTAHVAAVLPAGNQGHGTCSYVNTKRVCEGLLYIDQLILANGKLDAEVMHQVRDSYKNFSAADKQAAYEDVIKLYRDVSTQAPSTSVMQHLALLEEFIMTTFIQRGSLGVDSASLQKLYHALPEAMQSRIPVQYAAQQAPKVSANPSMAGRGFFHKTSREILVCGEPRYVKAHETQISKLISFLKDNHLDGINIRKIKVESDFIMIYTKDDPVVKADIRDNLFKAKLNATIKNISGEYYFKVENFLNLTIPHVPNQKKTL